MKALYKHLLLWGACPVFSAAAFAQTVYKAPFRSDGEVRVYETQYKSEADLLVFKAAYKVPTGDNRGMWFFTDTRSIADKRVYFTDNRNDADIVIFYTPYASEAGWRNQQKKQLMEVKKK